MRVIVLSGLSGSGKSVALNALEDLGFYCMDNIPAELLATVIGSVSSKPHRGYADIAIGLDARNRTEDIQQIPQLLGRLRDDGIDCEVVFLQADDEILLSRFSETRRRHPLAQGGVGLRDAVALERELLGPVIDASELIIDTTRTNVYQLREIIQQRVADRENPALSILIESFGYKHRLPADADFVFDVRCLPNPYWEPRLRQLNGRDGPVIEFLQDQPMVTEMVDDIVGFLRRWIPRYQDFRRAYLTIAIGCTGGQHRSVFVAERVADKLSKEFGQIPTRHSELP